MFENAAHPSLGELNPANLPPITSTAGDYDNPPVLARGVGSGVFSSPIREVFATRAACSFSGTTLVLMADGTRKPIEDVEVGDKVLATDPETGETVAREVTQLWVHDDTLVDLIVDGDVITTTEDHPFWNETDHEWQRADQLDEGDLVRSADGELLKVEGLDWSSAQAATAHNLTVDDIHTYYVAAGDDTVLVHTTCGTGLDPKLYGEDDLSQAVLEQRVIRGDSTGNYAAGEVDGRVFVGRSDDLLHAEEDVLRQVEAAGHRNSDISRLYTEYSPCRGPEHVCSIIAGRSGSVSYHIPYGSSGYQAARDRMLASAFDKIRALGGG